MLGSDKKRIEEIEEAAEILEDIADVADMRGRASEQRIGAVYIDREHGERMRYLAKSLRAMGERMEVPK